MLGESTNGGSQTDALARLEAGVRHASRFHADAVFLIHLGDLTQNGLRSEYERVRPVLEAIDFNLPPDPRQSRRQNGHQGVFSGPDLPGHRSLRLPSNGTKGRFGPDPGAGYSCRSRPDGQTPLRVPVPGQNELGSRSDFRTSFRPRHPIHAPSAVSRGDRDSRPEPRGERRRIDLASRYLSGSRPHRMWPSAPDGFGYRRQARIFSVQRVRPVDPDRQTSRSSRSGRL